MHKQHRRKRKRSQLTKRMSPRTIYRCDSSTYFNKLLSSKHQKITIHTMTIIGKAVHLSIDLMLISTCLAGIKRNTGLTPKLDKWENPTVKQYLGKYLNIGESFYDYSVATCGSSSYFVRK